MKVDDREHDLIERLRVEDVAFEIERLPLGDIVIEHNGTTAIVERKRTDDFAASITLFFDGVMVAPFMNTTAKKENKSTLTT